MYLPFLRGKQFEFLALREIATELDDCSKVMPIIEPVKKDLKAANNAFAVMKQERMKFAFILNPSQGDFENPVEGFTQSVIDLLGVNDLWVPAFILGKNTPGDIKATIEKYGLTEVMLVETGSLDVDRFDEILSMPESKYIVYADADSRMIERKLRKYPDIQRVRLDDNFRAEKTNKGYRGQEDQKFTDMHRFYSEEGFWGMADYTTLPSSFNDGGALPRVLAIHMTYEKNADEIWIRHSLSCSYDNGPENIQQKFKEAAEDVRDFFAGKKQTTGITALVQYLSEGKYPGLGVLKKLSMKNHITLMSQF